MDYEAYRNKFHNWLKTHGSLQAHIEFIIQPSDLNPNYQSLLAQETDLNIRRWINQPYPGLKYQRQGYIFKLDIIAANDNSGHADFFGRALEETYPKSHARTIRSQLPKGY